MNQVQQLESRRNQLRSSIHQLRGDLIRNERVIGGEHVLVGLRDAIRTREAELERVEFDLHRARQPQPVHIPIGKRQVETVEQWLIRARREIVLRRDQRHAAHETQVQSVLGPYREMVEADRAILYRNHFGESEASRRKADENDAQVLAEIDRRLGELEQPEAEEIAS
jgi:hypothetical protein